MQKEDIGFLYEDDVVLIVHKPAGLVVNKSETQKEFTLQDFLEEYFLPSQRGIGDRAGIVHRLDKETSGLLVVAKTKEAFDFLQAQFKGRTVVKKYTLLVHGVMKTDSGKIDGPIARNPYNRTKFGVFAEGRPAVTLFRVLERLREYTLIEARPETGRTHQIRVHFKYLGYPVVGDALYAGRKTARNDRKWCPRQFLHASYLELEHPVTRKRLRFEDPLPKDLTEVLNRARG